MVDLVYRPVFLEAGRLLKEESGEGLLRGDLSFRAPGGDESVESAFALFLNVWGIDCFWKARRRADSVELANCFGYRIRLELGASAWEGGGWLDKEGYRLLVDIGSVDRLRSCKSGSPILDRPLPEGDGRYYAELDGRECAEGGRESAILPPALRAEAAARCAGLEAQP